MKIENTSERIVMNMPANLHTRIEDYKVLKRLRLNLPVPKTSEAIIDVLVLGLQKLEEMIDPKINSDLHKISTDKSFDEKIKELKEFEKWKDKK